MNKKCIICGCESFSDILSARDSRFKVSDKEFALHQCKECGLISLAAILFERDLAPYYPPENYHVSISERLYYPLGKISFNKTIKVLKDVKPEGKLLDVGFGTGVFTKELHDSGYDVVGIDNSPLAHEAAPPEIRDRLMVNNLQECGFPEEHFDIVVVRQVLEHLTNPTNELREVWRLLKPNGILYVEVPNFDCIESKLFGVNWYNLEVPRHVYQFTEETLCKLLKKNEFMRLSQISGLSFIHSSPLSVYKSLRYMLMDKKISANYFFDMIATLSIPVILLLTLASRLPFINRRPNDLRILFEKTSCENE